MSTIRTYEIFAGQSPPLRLLLDGVKIQYDWSRPLQPGDTITHHTWDGVGILISINESEATVLWSIAPNEPDWTRIKLPNIKRVNIQAIAKQLIKVQPMKAPSSSIFYLDYTYGNESTLDKRCKTGTWLSKIWWRSYRWVKQLTLRFMSSVQSCLRSLRIKSGTTTKIERSDEPKETDTGTRKTSASSCFRR